MRQDRAIISMWEVAWCFVMERWARSRMEWFPIWGLVMASRGCWGRLLRMGWSEGVLSSMWEDSRVWITHPTYSTPMTLGEPRTGSASLELNFTFHCQIHSSVVDPMSFSLTFILITHAPHSSLIHSIALSLTFTLTTHLHRSTHNHGTWSWAHHRKTVPKFSNPTCLTTLFTFTSRHHPLPRNNILAHSRSPG